MAYDRIIRLRGSTVFEPASRASFGYELDPEYNRGVRLVVRGYMVAEDYSLEEFAALMKTEAEKRAEAERFRTVFRIDSRDVLEKADSVSAETPPADATGSNSPLNQE